MFSIRNISHPNAAYFQHIFGFEIEQEIHVLASEIAEVMQTACEKFRLFLTAPVTVNHL